MKDAKLIEVAVGARAAAYAPYSRFAVGAALLTSTGKIAVGCNVENASFGLTMCAERVAVGAALAMGERDFTVLALSLPGGGSPCGACRQVLWEFSPELRILMADEEGNLVREAFMKDLLPDAFGPKSLG